MDTNKIASKNIAVTPPPPQMVSGLFNNDQSNTIALLRIIAAVGVFAVHTYMILAVGGFSAIAKYGQDGLWIFYILSGLLVMQSYAESRSLKDYWRKRLSRTLPSYYFWLAVIIIFRFEWITADPFAIPRAFFMLEYLTPPTVSYAYCSMYLIGVLTIFMMFYILVPFISRSIKSLETAFIGFWVAIILCEILPSIFNVLYGRVCDPTDLTTMVAYLLASVPYFAVGVMMYFGLKENRKLEMIIYFAIIFIACTSYDFLYSYKRVSYVAIMVVGILCVPLKLEKYSKELRFFNKYTMGLFITHAACIGVAKKIANILAFGGTVQFVLTVILSCTTAVLIYHFVEVPGAKLINRIMGEKQNTV